MDINIDNALYKNLRDAVTGKVVHDRDVLERIRREIIRRLEDSFNSNNELKQSTSKWLASYKYSNVRILDPDGWNREGETFRESWDEKITEFEFESRLCTSTIQLLKEQRE